MPAATLFYRHDRAAWLWAAALSLLAHAAFLQAPPTSARLTSRAPAMQTRQLQLPIPAVQAAELPRPPAVKSAKSVKRAMVAPAHITEPRAATAPPLAISPSGEWHYLLRQNGQEGTARLSWQTDGAAYQLLLERELAGKPLPAWRSVGGFDAEGLAPQRFAHQKRGRDVQAANFRRDEGLVSFSASPAIFPLPAGVQDRLSWWMQIPARLAGAPQRWLPGSELKLMVTGLRGELQEWSFEVLETAPLVHLRRAALGPYDGALQLWLDPQRDYLPARLLAGTPEQPLWEMEAVSNDKAKP